MRVHVLIGSMLVAASLVAEASEPIVVLEYGQRGGGHEYADETSNHPFRMDPNYQESHKVMPDETLGHIMQAYYGGSGLNMTFVEMAIVQFNTHAFVRGNPNYLFADKVLHLPSLNEIRAMLVKQPSPESDADITDDNRNHIFFFGS